MTGNAVGARSGVFFEGVITAGASAPPVIGIHGFEPGRRKTRADEFARDIVGGRDRGAAVVTDLFEPTTIGVARCVFDPGTTG